MTSNIAYAIYYDISYAVLYYIARIVVDKHRGKIKTLRIKMGWSQEDLAQRVYVSLSTIQRWESKKVIPSRLAWKELTRLFRKAKIDSG